MLNDLYAVYVVDRSVKNMIKNVFTSGKTHIGFLIDVIYLYIFKLFWLYQLIKFLYVSYYILLSLQKLIYYSSLKKSQ